MKIGDKVRQEIFVGAPPGNNLPPRMQIKQTGTVVYIHPQARFYTVRFDFPLGSLRESYFFPEREGNQDAPKYIEARENPRTAVKYTQNRSCKNEK